MERRLTSLNELQVPMICGRRQLRGRAGRRQVGGEANTFSTSGQHDGDYDDDVLNDGNLTMNFFFGITIVLVYEESEFEPRQL